MWLVVACQFERNTHRVWGSIHTLWSVGYPPIFQQSPSSEPNPHPTSTPQELALNMGESDWCSLRSSYFLQRALNYPCPWAFRSAGGLLGGPRCHVHTPPENKDRAGTWWGEYGDAHLHHTVPQGMHRESLATRHHLPRTNTQTLAHTYTQGNTMQEHTVTRGHTHTHKATPHSFAHTLHCTVLISSLTHTKLAHLYFVSSACAHMLITYPNHFTPLCKTWLSR